MKEGDRVLINLKRYLKEERRILSPWRKMENAVGTIMDIEASRLHIKAELHVNGVSPDEWSHDHATGKIPKGFVTLLSCPHCGDDKTYHDGKEEWICLFCDVDE